MQPAQTARTDHEKELHQRVVDGRRGGLDQEDVRIAHVFAELDIALAVVEAPNRRLAERHPENVGNALCKIRRRTARSTGACGGGVAGGQE